MTLASEPIALGHIQSPENLIHRNDSAALWKIGDGIACLEITSKANTIDDKVLDMIGEAIRRGKKGEFKGLVIGGTGDKFSSGANLKKLKELADRKDWNAIEQVIEQGQNIMLEMKYAPFPIVAAIPGPAHGGGCELSLHTAAVQMLERPDIRLVETYLGLIPAFGGCTELLMRHHGDYARVFDIIANLRAPSSSQDAQAMKFVLPGKYGVSTERSHTARNWLLADAKQRCLDMIAEGYEPPGRTQTVHLPGENAPLTQSWKTALGILANQVDGYDHVVWKKLGEVLRGGKDGGDFNEPQLLALERKTFMELIQMPETQQRIARFLTKKPVKNGGSFVHRVGESIRYAVRGR